MRDFTGAKLDYFWGQRANVKECPVRLVGIRGASGPNRFTIYDDVILRIIGGKVDQWQASTDPSWPLVVHAINPEGAALLCPGVHLMEKHMLHRKFPCLGQAENVHVERLDKHGFPQKVESGDFGICIHSGGSGMDTGRFSAGCQIIANRDGYFKNPTWELFWGPIRDTMTKLNLQTVPYLLVEAKQLPT